MVCILTTFWCHVLNKIIIHFILTVLFVYQVNQDAVAICFDNVNINSAAYINFFLLLGGVHSSSKVASY